MSRALATAWSGKTSTGTDREHGARAAEYALELNREVLRDLAYQRSLRG